MKRGVRIFISFNHITDMYYLIIDTCIWINLGKDHIEIREKLSSLVDQGKVRLIVPQIVIEEWDKHKQPKIVGWKEASIRGMIKNAKILSQYLEKNESNEFKRILEEFQQQKDKIIHLALEEIKAIDRLLNYPSTIKLPIKNNIKLQAVELALAKKAPFGKKNSMADALIFLSAIDYILNNHLTNCIFISNNTGDFSSKADVTKIHEELSELFNGSEIRYFINIGSAMNEIEKDLVSSELIDEINNELQFEVAQKIIENYNPAIEKMFREQQLVVEALKNPAIERMFREQQLVAEALKNPAIEKMFEEQRRLAEALKNPTIERMLKEQRRLAETFKRPAIERMLKEQWRFAEASKSPAMERMLKEQRRFVEAFKSPAMERMLKEQQRFAEAFKNPAIEKMFKDMQRLGSITAPENPSFIEEEGESDVQNKDKSKEESSNDKNMTNDKDK